MTSPAQIIQSGGDLVAQFLGACGVLHVFGVISVHNLPILDAIQRHGSIRYVPARSEAGAVNMADGYARVSGGLGVVVTSTGPGAGNSAGGMLEALTAGTPLLHLTGQIESPYLDQGRAYLHEAKDQLGMLSTVSKQAFRVNSAESLVDVLPEAYRVACSAPSGPVSVEIPIDVQKSLVSNTLKASFVPEISPFEPDDLAIEHAAEMLREAKQPLIWAGGGAIKSDARMALRRLVEIRTIGVLTGACGRGILPEDHPLCIGNFAHSDEVRSLLEECDLMVVVGSHLRGHETKNWTLPFPKNLLVLDVDREAENRNYPCALFVQGDARLSLERILDVLGGEEREKKKFTTQIAKVKEKSRTSLRGTLGPYEEIMDALRISLDREAIFVRDVTIANSTWGNRLFEIYEPHTSVHAVGGGIGQGLQMAIGAKAAMPAEQVVVLCGDGGLSVNLGEMATATQENLPIVLVVFNDRGYGVIRNIQHAGYEGRVFGVDLEQPDFLKLAEMFGYEGFRVRKAKDFGSTMHKALMSKRSCLIEVETESVGPYVVPFGGPILDKRL